MPQLITDPEQRFVYSNLGWVDHGSLWTFDVRTERASLVPLSDSRYLTLLPGSTDTFSVVHHFDARRILITVQTYEDPATPAAQVDVGGWKPVLAGDQSVWGPELRAFVGYLSDSATGSAGYYLIRLQSGAAEVTRLDWFSGRDYDLDYQSIVGVAVLPSTSELVFGIQRSSHLVVCSPDGSSVVREVSLAGHVGNPVPRLRVHAHELIATDYDVVTCIDYGSWRVARTFDGGRAEGVKHFIGDPWWPVAEDLLVVARPAVGDVVVLDMESFEIKVRVHTGRQPLDAAMLHDGRVIARDWKSGDLLQAPTGQ